MSVRLSAYINSATNGCVSVEFDIEKFFENLSRKQQTNIVIIEHKFGELYMTT